MNTQYNRCLGCMHEIEDGVVVCPRCGFDHSREREADILPAYAKVANRFIVGRVLESNGESVTYIGYDTVQGGRVKVREYFPDRLCARVPNSCQVAPTEGCGAQYKTYLSEFVDLAWRLSRLNVNILLPTLHIFEQNGTAYVVYKFLPTITLQDFINRNGGELTVEQAKQLFLPLMEGLATIHANNILHRGIGPQTILIDRSGNLYLSNFALAPLRSLKSELNPELFEGFAAPEQYDIRQFQGTWTDVYAMAAVIYRVLSGTSPMSAYLRRFGDNLLPLHEINQSVSIEFSHALQKALSLDTSARTQTMRELIISLQNAQSVKQPFYNGIVMEEIVDEAPSAPKPVAKHEPKSPKNGQAPKKTLKKNVKSSFKGRSLLIMLASFTISAVLLSFLYYSLFGGFLSRENDSPDTNLPSSSVATGDVMPNFVGQTYESIKQNREYTSQFVFITEENYNENYEAGYVYEQSPREGEAQPEDNKVTLKISKGSEFVTMPRVVGLTTEQARAELDRLNIKYQIIELEDREVEPGIVTRCEFEAGDMVSMEKDTVLVFVSKAPEESSSASSEPEEVIEFPFTVIN